MAYLSLARLIVIALPFRRWRHRLGCESGAKGTRASKAARAAAALVEHAASRLPFDVKCLPRAMALSWILRHRHVAHSVVIAVRPASQRDTPDALHAWVEVEGATILGELPGPWVETCRLGP